MLRFLARRILQAIPVVFGVVTLTFVLTKTAPGDPVNTILGDSASFQEKQSLRAELGLDRPVLQQYFSYLAGISKFDLGESYVSKKSVSQLVLSRLPATAELSLLAMLGAVILGLGFALIWRFNGLSFLMPVFWSYSVIGLTLPAVILGPFLVWLFAIQLDWLPISEREGWLSYLLPSMSLSIPLGAVISRITHTSFAEVLTEPFVQSLKAKGLPSPVIQLKHVLVKSLLPVVTVVGLQSGALLTGTVITETIFDWPGIGTLLYEALSSRDFPLIGGCVLVISLTYVFVNLATDVLSAWLNPHFRDELFSSGGSASR